MLYQHTVPELIQIAKDLRNKAEQAEIQVEQSYAALGSTLAELKRRKPKGVTWRAFVEKNFGYSQERADELIRIADGKTTVEEVRSRAKASTKKSRANSVTRVTGNTSTKSTSEPETKPLRASITAPVVFRKLVPAGDIPLARQVNLITDELDGFVGRWIDSVKGWIEAYREELATEDENQVGGTGKDCLMRSIYNIANELTRLAQSIDGR